MGRVLRKIDPALVVIVLSLVITVGSVWCAWNIYTDHVGFEYSNESSQWAALGGYLAGIGGVLGPILSAASILFVWWQSKEATANQQSQINKLNQQLGLEKQQMFRQEFLRLFNRALEEANKEICAGYQYSEIFRKSMHARNHTQRDLSLNVKPNAVSRQPPSWYCTDYVLEQGWQCLQNYLVYVFELADLLENRASEYGMKSCQLEAYARQFKHEFYKGKKDDLEFITALVAKFEIHGYQKIEAAFTR